ncbi:unnamed protein product [Caenorhabditis sp. 36 PRJEB53466]|nr:unnamed protein product [Caenorhabditis sp. 36 PRJEB53466]
MYVNLPHYYIPKLCGFLSFVFNLIFIYLLISDRKLKLGSYRHLLVSFSFFNILYSLYDGLVPMCIHSYRYAFVVFISEGLFFDFSPLGQFALSVRCGVISVTYAILHAHFVYRYLALYKRNLIDDYFMPYGLVSTFLYCFCHLSSWAAVCELFFYGDEERKEYVHDSFKTSYDIESHEINMVIALYWEGSDGIVMDSWIGVIIVTISSTYSMGLYFLLGYKILDKLKNQITISANTLNMQRQLFKALTVQTVIPLCVSLLPCLAVWFGPVFLLDFRGVYLTSVIAVSIFPCIDPLAIIIFLPSLRGRFRLRITSVTSVFLSTRHPVF